MNFHEPFPRRSWSRRTCGWLSVAAAALGLSTAGCSVEESTEPASAEPPARTQQVLTGPPSSGRTIDGGAPNLCTATCLAGGCPGAINVRKCVTPACTGVGADGGPATTDDYGLLSNAAAYVNAHSGTPGAPTTMLYTGTFNVSEIVQNVTGAAVGPPHACNIPGGGCGAVCPTPQSDAGPIMFGPGAGGTVVHDFQLLGCSDPITGSQPVINLEGGFTRTADYMSDPPGPDGASNWYSCEDAVTPFMMTSTSNFTISNLEINGNNQQTLKNDIGCDSGTCSSYTGEGNSFGIYTAGATNYNLTNLHVHNIGTDAIYLGNGDVSHPDMFATVTQVDLNNNGRDALSIGLLNYASFNNVNFRQSGKPCVGAGATAVCGPAAYAGFAGVDIEPNDYSAFAVFEVQFNSCNFYDNYGPGFTTVMPNEVKEVSFSRCYFGDWVESIPRYMPQDPTHYKYLATFGIADGTVSGCVFDDQTGSTIQVGAVWPPPLANDAGVDPTTTASTMTLSNNWFTLAGARVDTPITDNYSAGPAGYPYQSVSLVNNVINVSGPPLPNTPACSNCVHPFMRLQENVNFIGNQVNLAVGVFPATPQLGQSGGDGTNPIALLSPISGSVHVYSALNTFAAPTLPTNEFFEVSYAGPTTYSQVCGDTLNGSLEPWSGQPWSDTGAPGLVAKTPFVQACGCEVSFPNNLTGRPDQVFVPTSAAGLGNMVGCGGQVTWANAKSLCSAGFHVCSSAEWDSFRGSTPPTDDYWTSDNLGYLGNGSNNCEATLSSNIHGYACPAGSPMRVCASSQPDSHQSSCNWVGCGLQTYTDQYFGGCGTTTASTLCCANTN